MTLKEFANKYNFTTSYLVKELTEKGFKIDSDYSELTEATLAFLDENILGNKKLASETDFEFDDSIDFITGKKKPTSIYGRLEYETRHLKIYRDSITAIADDCETDELRAEILSIANNLSFAIRETKSLLGRLRPKPRFNGIKPEVIVKDLKAMENLSMPFVGLIVYVFDIDSVYQYCLGENGKQNHWLELTSENE